MSSALASRTTAHCRIPHARALAATHQITRVDSRTIRFASAALAAHPKSEFSAAQTRARGSRSLSSKKEHGGERPAPSDSAAPPPSAPPPDQPFPAPYYHPRPPPPPRSPITKWVLASPARTEFFYKIGDWLGYGSPKQLAATRSHIMYTICSEVAGGPERTFWYDTLSLPPTFQSWFTITNLHVWLVTVRLRALPPPHGRPFIQALIDHFFLDVEDRLRAVLGKKAPERLVTRQMKILREQWGGLGLAFDHGLVAGDKDMASAIWRNLLGARGAQGIAYPAPDTPADAAAPSADPAPPKQKPDDPATGGVTDFEGSAIDKYVLYPQLMLALTAYLRRELVRLEHVSDADILGGVSRGMRARVGAVVVRDLREAVKFGKVRDAARRVGADAGVFERVV